MGSSKASSHKYLQVGLLADENVAAKHGNNTADFLLILANIVRNSLKNKKKKLNADGACVYYGLLFELKLESSLVRTILFLTCDKLVFASVHVNHFKIDQLVA